MLPYLLIVERDTTAHAHIWKVLNNINITIKRSRSVIRIAPLVIYSSRSPATLQSGSGVRNSRKALITIEMPIPFCDYNTAQILLANEYMATSDFNPSFEHRICVEWNKS